MLKGTLDDFTLPDVLRLVAAARRTGCLDVTRDCGGGRLWFRDGAIAGAAPGYERRSAAATPEGRIEDLAFDLMRWELGEFRWAPGADAPAGDASVDVGLLLGEVARRLEELAEVRTLVPSEAAVLSWAPQPPEGAVQINISPSEWRLLVLVDGRRPVTEIAAAAGLDDVEAMKVLFGLAAAGLVRATGAPPAPAPAPDFEPAPEPAVEPEPAAAAPDPEPAPEPAVGPETTAAALEGDPFLAELVAAEAPDPLARVPEAPGDESPAVDRSTAARELAGLFDLAEGPGAPLAGALFPAPPRTPRRVEDDDQVTRGLISRLIDGVKGL